MTVIERLQAACEDANREQASAEDVAFRFEHVSDSGPLDDEQARALALSLNAGERAYTLSRAILLERPSTPRDALIMLTHLVQHLGLVATDHATPQTELARSAAQAVLSWHLDDAHTNMSGWALEAIHDTQSQVAARYAP